MSTLAQFTGGDGPVATIVNNGGSTVANCHNAAAISNSVPALSGAMTANTLKTGLSLTGRGRINFLTVYCADATSRTIRVKITIDGTAAYDKTSSAIAATNSGVVAIGGWLSGYNVVFQPINFNTSLLIEFASSVTETDKLSVAPNYETWV